LKPVVVAVVGGKKSGKTTTIETLIVKLTERGYSVAAVKHISEKSFTIDTEGKDTWRFAHAGAKTIVAVSSNEVAVIQRRKSSSFSLRQILRECRGNDFILLEGFRDPVAKNKRILKVVTVKSAEEAQEALNTMDPVKVFVGPFSTEDMNLKVPYVNALANSERLADIVEDALKRK
jgi:molybdopterin-guanine dinucleotide biosynthesis protein B